MARLQGPAALAIFVLSWDLIKKGLRRYKNNSIWGRIIEVLSWDLIKKGLRRQQVPSPWSTCQKVLSWDLIKKGLRLGDNFRDIIACHRNVLSWDLIKKGLRLTFQASCLWDGHPVLSWDLIKKGLRLSYTCFDPDFFVIVLSWDRNSLINRGIEILQSYFHRRDAESAENLLFLFFTERAKNKKTYPAGNRLIFLCHNQPFSQRQRKKYFTLRPLRLCGKIFFLCRCTRLLSRYLRPD